MIKRKINLLLVLFIFVLSIVFIGFSSDIKANDENKYWTYVQIEYKEVNYKLSDYPEHDKYNIQDKEFLDKQRILKIPYLVYNIASKEFSKNLDIDDVTLEYKKSRMSEDLKKVYDDESEDKKILLKKDEKSKLATYQISQDVIDKTLNKIDKGMHEKVKLYYNAYNYFMLKNNSKFEVKQIEKVVVDSNGRIDFMVAQGKECKRENKRIGGGLDPRLDLYDYADTSEGVRKVFGNNYYYYKLFLGSISEVLNKGFYFDNFKILSKKLLNAENNETHNLNDLVQFKSDNHKKGQAFFLKDELHDEIIELNNNYVASNKNTNNGTTKKGNNILIIALAVAIPLLLILIIVPIMIVAIKNKRKTK